MENTYLFDEILLSIDNFGRESTAVGRVLRPANLASGINPIELFTSEALDSRGQIVD